MLTAWRRHDGRREGPDMILACFVLGLSTRKVDTALLLGHPTSRPTPQRGRVASPLISTREGHGAKDKAPFAVVMRL